MMSLSYAREPINSFLVASSPCTCIFLQELKIHDLVLSQYRVYIHARIGNTGQLSQLECARWGKYCFTPIHEISVFKFSLLTNFSEISYAYSKF
jgi:hypothetical protein